MKEDVNLEDKLSYGTLTMDKNNGELSCMWFDTFNEAKEDAKFRASIDKSVFIIERSEHFEIVGRVRGKNK